MAASPVAETAPTPWHGGWLAPLNLATYVTWLAVALQSIEPARLLAGEARVWIGTGLLVLMLAAYLGAELRWLEARPQLQRGLVLLQAAATLGATWMLRHYMPGILLIIVAAQVIALWPRRSALWLMGAINLALFALWSAGQGAVEAALGVLPLIGFQTFAALVMHYAMSAEQARQALAHTHAELLATQHLLEDGARAGERLRLSRELHDVCGHSLTALRLNLRLLGRDPALAAREEFVHCTGLVDDLLADIRSVVGELRRHERIDLPGAIATLVRRLPGTRFEIDIDPQLAVERIETAEILLRCAQEGITNALRHARARHIALSCRRAEPGIVLRIRNDGEAPRELRFGHGLTGMRERLHGIGGSLELRALPGGGAELCAQLPLAA